MPNQIRIAVVDDHPLFRQGVAATLDAEANIEVVAQGGCAADAVRICEQLLPDVLLLDITMPGDGLQAARQIALSCPFVKIVILTASEADEHVLAALESGARGYVLKGVSLTELVRTINAILVGETYVTPALAARLLKQVRQGPVPGTRDSDYDSLTVREEEILDEVAQGLTNKEVANRLGISEKTVKHYMTNIMEKLQVRNRVEAALRNRNTNRDPNAPSPLRRGRR
jgi:DNA-binding NarL/FixJ family response regulator